MAEPKLTTEKKIYISSKEARGVIIQNAIEIERMMEYYIGKCFCRTENKITELILLMIAPIQFSQKKELFDFLIQSHNKKFLSKHMSCLSKIGTIIKERNIFAHWSADFSKHAEQDFEQRGVISFVKLKRSKKANTRKELLLPDMQTYSEKR